jgi:hypothetical protein
MWADCPREKLAGPSCRGGWIAKGQSQVWHLQSRDWIAVITQDQDRRGVTLHHLDPYEVPQLQGFP